MKKYQQGDVLFISEDESKVMINSDGQRLIKIDDWSKAHQNDITDDIVIALGEETGHSHTFYGQDNPNIAVNTYGYNRVIKGLGKVPMFVEVKAKPEKFATLKHEEHNKLELPPGLYRTRIVREFDHLSQRTRNVVD